MEHIKLSIIITLYNREKYIARCLESLINQNIDNYEIIVIDDGSTDNSKKIVENIIDLNENKRIIYQYKENEGVSSARNLGLDLAKGEYITYVDSDDYVEANSYLEIYDFAKNNNCDIIVYDAKIIFEDNKEIYSKAIDSKYSRYITNKEYMVSTPSPCNKIIKNSILKDNNFSFPIGMVYEDFAMIPTLGNYAKKIYYYKKAIYYYIQSQGSIMREDSFKDKYLDVFKAVDILYDRINVEEFHDELEYLFWSHLLLEFGLLFYKYKRYDLIEKIDDIFKEKFPNWKKNKYIKRHILKEKFYTYIFYDRKFIVLEKLQELKRKILRGNNK